MQPLRRMGFAVSMFGWRDCCASSAFGDVGPSVGNSRIGLRAPSAASCTSLQLALCFARCTHLRRPATKEMPEVSFQVLSDSAS